MSRCARDISGCILLYVVLLASRYTMLVGARPHALCMWDIVLNTDIDALTVGLYITRQYIIYLACQQLRKSYAKWQNTRRTWITVMQQGLVTLRTIGWRRASPYCRTDLSVCPYICVSICLSATPCHAYVSHLDYRLVLWPKSKTPIFCHLR